MNSPQPPWLVLPPVFEGGGADMVYKFYSLAGGEILSFNKRNGGGVGTDSGQIPPDDAKFVGSSHGWLALHDARGERESQHVFLSNPISGRHIKLPPCSWPSHVSLSSSPDEHDCRAAAVIGYGSPAFCVPRVSTEWDRFKSKRYERNLCYEDFAYCNTRKVFTFISHTKFKFCSDRFGVESSYFDPHHQIDDWDLTEEEVEIETTWFWKYQGEPHAWKENEDVELLTKHCYQKLRVVHAEQFDLPLVVVWCTLPKSPHKTAGFVVVQIEKYGENCCTKGCIRVVEDLKGLAIFVGEENQSFAIRASDFPGVLKPNSIYFAGECKDVGIFDYEKKTFAPVLDDDEYFVGGEAAVYAPMWFTPTTS